MEEIEMTHAEKMQYWKEHDPIHFYEMGGQDNRNKGGFGFWVFIIILAVISIVYFCWSQRSLRTTEKINPEWQLVTDGKVVDTLWIYKIK